MLKESRDGYSTTFDQSVGLVRLFNQEDLTAFKRYAESLPDYKITDDLYPSNDYNERGQVGRKITIQYYHRDLLSFAVEEACQTKNYKKLHFLLENFKGKFDINHKFKGQNPIGTAIQYEDFYLLKTLLDLGADITTKINDYDNVLTSCLRTKQSITILNMLFQHGAKQRETSDENNPAHKPYPLSEIERVIFPAYGITLFSKAVEVGNAAAIEWFIELGADVNLAQETQRLPLLISIINGHLEVTELLLAYGANPFLKPSQGGKTTFELVVDMNINSSRYNDKVATPENLKKLNALFCFDIALSKLKTSWDEIAEAYNSNDLTKVNDLILMASFHFQNNWADKYKQLFDSEQDICKQNQTFKKLLIIASYNPYAPRYITEIQKTDRCYKQLLTNWKDNTIDIEQLDKQLKKLKNSWFKDQDKITQCQDEKNKKTPAYLFLAFQLSLPIPHQFSCAQAKPTIVKFAIEAGPHQGIALMMLAVLDNNPKQWHQGKAQLNATVYDLAKKDIQNCMLRGNIDLKLSNEIMAAMQNATMQLSSQLTVSLSHSYQKTRQLLETNNNPHNNSVPNNQASAPDDKQKSFTKMDNQQLAKQDVMVIEDYQPKEKNSGTNSSTEKKEEKVQITDTPTPW